MERPANLDHLTQTFYHQNQLDGPYQTYQMDRPYIKGRYTEGKADGERFTYFFNGVVQEKAIFTNGRRSGVWEYRSLQGALQRLVTYGSNGAIVQDERF